MDWEQDTNAGMENQMRNRHPSYFDDDQVRQIMAMAKRLMAMAGRMPIVTAPENRIEGTKQED
jgi:hypothetical protein